MRRLRFVTLVASGVVGLLGTVPTPAPAQQWLAFRGTLGHEWLGGSIADALKGATRSEWTVMLLPFGPVSLGAIAVKPRLGAGLSRITYEAAQQLQSTIPPEGAHWNHLRWHAMAGAEVLSVPWVEVYLEYRKIWGHLRSQTFVESGWHYEDPPQRLPYPQWRVKGTEFVAGMKTDLGGRIPVHLDVLFRRGDISPRGAPEFDLSKHGLTRKCGQSDCNFPGGTGTGFQIGVYWHP